MAVGLAAGRTGTSPSRPPISRADRSVIVVVVVAAPAPACAPTPASVSSACFFLIAAAIAMAARGGCGSGDGGSASMAARWSNAIASGAVNCQVIASLSRVRA